MSISAAPDRSTRSATGFLSKWRSWDGRWLAWGMMTVYLALIKIIAAIDHSTFSIAWLKAGIPVRPQLFMDLHDVAEGLDRFRQAQDPWSSTSVAYAVSAYSYTKWWLLFAYTGLNQGNVFAYAVVLILVYLGAVMFVLGRLRLWEGFVAGLLLISPAIMTGVERGNGDMLIFILLALGLALRKIPGLATIPLLVATFLKLYPAAAFLALASPPWKKTLPWIGAALAVFGLDLLASRGDLQGISAGVPHHQWFSFGSATIWLRLQHNFPKIFSYADLMIFGSVCFLVAVFYAIRSRPIVQVKPEWEREFFAFRIGALIFIGSYAMGTNFDYRMSFLFFCLPLLFVLQRETGSIRRWAQVSTTLIVAYSCWHFFFEHNFRSNPPFYIKQVMAWSNLVCLVAILAGVSEPWMKSLFPRARAANDLGSHAGRA